MRADLYLNSVFQKNRDRYAPKFNHWVAKRDTLHKAGQQAAADEAQKQVLKYYDKMYQRGYFRDSYNSSDLLWLFDLSWWRNVRLPTYPGGGRSWGFCGFRGLLVPKYAPAMVIAITTMARKK